MFNADPKDPDATLDYHLDWTDWLTDVSSTILTSVWVLPEDIVEEGSTVSGNKTTVIVSGGVVGNRYQITNRITTANGLGDDRSIRFKISER